MGKITGFMELDRSDRTYKPAEERVGKVERVYAGPEGR